MSHRNKVLHKALAVLVSSIHTAVLLRVQMKRFYFPTNSPQRIKVQTASPPTHPFFNSWADSCVQIEQHWAPASAKPPAMGTAPGHRARNPTHTPQQGSSSLGVYPVSKRRTVPFNPFPESPAAQKHIPKCGAEPMSQVCWCGLTHHSWCCS